MDLASKVGKSLGLVAVLLLFADADTWISRLLLIGLIYLTLGINGFGAHGATWQRALGIYGGLVAMIGLSLSIEGSNAGFWRAVLFLIIGMIAFGFGTLYLQRQGGPSSVMAHPETTMKMVQSGATYGEAVEAAPQPILDRIPTPVKHQSDLDGIEVDDDTPEDDVEEEASASEAEDMPIEASAPELESTAVDDMMDLLIDEAMRVRLHAAIRNTPHEGFRPTLKITERGEVMLEFLPN